MNSFFLNFKSIKLSNNKKSTINMILKYYILFIDHYTFALTEAIFKDTLRLAVFTSN